MQTMDREELGRIIARYAKRLNETRPNELYKWEATYCFQQHWNLDAENLADMVKASLAKASNLLLGGQYFPSGMLVIYAADYPEETRAALADLLDERKPLRDRLETFSQATNQINAARNEKMKAIGEKPAANTYQDARAMSVYLAFAHPEKHYLYKAEMYRRFAKRVGVKVPGNKFDKLIEYSELCEELLEVLNADYPELIQESDNLLAPEYRDVDPSHHLLVQDVIFFATAYDWPPEEETEPLGEEAPLEMETSAYPSYADQDFLAEVFLHSEDLFEMKELLRRKKNLILQGAPGTGKTFAAMRLAYAFMGAKDASRVQMVQFHQSTAYDDFVYGYRPNDAGGFDTVPGVFVDFCRRAEANPTEAHFFIIDEINRANISKVFGELLMLIEADHRGDAVIIPVAQERFAVPENVYIIGMMNTADRSLALIDYALRRRFAFFEMEPALVHPNFLAESAKGGEGVVALVGAVSALNETIAADPALGRGFRIGHSYFCVGEDAPADVAESIIKYELAPLIEEYWFDNPGKVEEEVRKLEDAVK